ncbi:MAG: DUF6259 domain-containing protein [Limisphaerales bacterium]
MRSRLIPLIVAVIWGVVGSPANSASPPPQDSDSHQTLRAAAGDLEVGLSRTADGIHLSRLYDRHQRQELLASNACPLFSMTFRQHDKPQETRLAAETGWQQTAIRKTRDGFELHWATPADETLAGVSVTARAIADAAHNAWRWTLRIANSNSAVGISRVIFPQVALTDFGEDAAVLFPRGPGEVQKNVWRRAFVYHGNYAGGWCSMQFMAAYRTGDQPTGLYLGWHDPWGSVKDLALESSPATRSVRLGFDQPAPNLGVAGNSFAPSGEAVWQLFRGDWFDAAQIYKTWVRNEARWWPRLGADGRRDTPSWMRELSVWVMTGGAPGDCVDRVKRFQQFMDLPTGFHWYNWHQIPFDNDYPHYFPAKPGFAAGVAELQRSHVFVMPYINGRLWDTHDDGTNDLQFSALALPAATKDDHLKPYLERYGSKETNGDPVELAVMCPSTRLWQNTVWGIVLKLLGETGTRAVYIDQISAAPPKLCMDPAHGHPLGGGHWWNEGYWAMLNTIRRGMPPGSMLTTECNGEPFVNVFDGYLTWHWQYDGQVPAFPAVYGGAVQMFGRAYRGGPTKDLALRMKAGQQLVFGEQIGWFDPDVIKDSANAEFLREVVRLRWRFRRYFHAGEMARPPKLLGPIPTVSADWQWSGVWPVTTDAVLTGAWQIPKEKRLVLLFVNVSDATVAATLPFNANTYAIRARKLNSRVVSLADKSSEPRTLPVSFQQPIKFPPRQAQAWELSW